MSEERKNSPKIGTDRASSDEKMSIEDIKGEVHRLSKDLGISIEEAERSLYGSYGIDVKMDQMTISDLSELEDGMRNVTFRARLITVHSGTRKGGGEYHYGLFGDSENTVKYSAWSKFDYSPGDGLLVQNASVREFREELEVVMNDHTLVSSIDDMEGLMPIVEEGVPGTIGELFPGIKRIDIECRVLDLTLGEISTKDGNSKEIMRGIIADRSGKIDVTCWDRIPLEKGRCYRLIGGYVKEYRGIQRLNLDGGVIVKGVADDRLPNVDVLKEPSDGRIREIANGRLSGEVRLRGTVVDVRSGSGIFKRCEECGRKLMKSQCTVHGKMKGEEDMAIRAVFDDGSGTCMLKGNRMIVESLLDRPMEAISNEVRASMDPDMITEELSLKLIGRSLTISGDPIIDDYGLTISLSTIDIGWDIEKMKDEISLLLEVVQ